MYCLLCTERIEGLFLYTILIKIHVYIMIMSVSVPFSPWFSKGRGGVRLHILYLLKHDVVIWITTPSSPVRQVRRAPDHFFGRICYPPYHFFAVSAASVVLTCDLIPSNHQKCRVLLIRLSLTHVVARFINRHSQGVKTIRTVVTRRA